MTTALLSEWLAGMIVLQSIIDDDVKRVVNILGAGGCSAHLHAVKVSNDVSGIDLAPVDVPVAYWVAKRNPPTSPRASVLLAS
jgi:hypothetical protein